ncbi:MAG: gliding motility-associated C-terminal domain-containing protein [Saprospiraceae bacterium]|nr:gliding motility-associated C-terminal domain-containing protein [Saprospiraceae bacterium]
MKKLTLTAFLLFSLLQILQAQPQPCGPNPEMTSFCNEACIICDIDGFTGINDDPQQGQAPPGFCTTQIHHMQWIGFIAGSVNLTVSVRAFNCQMNQGLEVGIYQSLNCQTFQLVSNCDTDISNNETAIFSNVVPLVIGQYYFLVMDGSAGDVCNYTIEVLNGTTAVGALQNSGTLTGDDIVCQNTPTEYHLSAPSGATMFRWTINGTPIAGMQDTVLERTWTTNGTFNLCATAFNVCDTAPPVCQTIVVQSIPPVFIDTVLCQSQCWTGANTTICDPGQYEFHLTGTEGCDSTIFLTVTVLPASTTNLDLLICDGDSIYVGGQPFFDSGQFQVGLETPNGCDSTINLALQVIECEIIGQLRFDSVLCTGQSSGQLHFTVENGTPPFNYSWERIGTGTPAGAGTIAALNTEETVGNLPVGTYFITITDNFGNDVILFGDLAEPPPLAGALSAPTLNGTHVSCFGGSDGSITALASGGTPPYLFAWNNNAQTASLNQLPAGNYSVTIQDANNCPVQLSQTLNQPPDLVLEVDFFDPGCEGLNTGSAQITLFTGGTPPFEFSIDGSDFDTISLFNNLSPGLHAVSMQDANGCIKSLEGFLATPLIPEIELGPNLSVLLAESVFLGFSQSTPLDTFIWSPSAGLSCTDCPEPQATPFHTTTYTLHVVAPGGCTTSDSVTVRVIAQRDIYVPNSFSPNSDGINDRFTVFAGPEASEIRSFNIWSRWGEHVFKAENFRPNQESAGWNGDIRGKPAASGIYVWVAEIAFVDGVVRQYTGDVVVVR